MEGKGTIEGGTNTSAQFTLALDYNIKIISPPFQLTEIICQCFCVIHEERRVSVLP